MQLDDWFLTAAQRGNPATRLDSRHSGGAAWSRGNLARPLIHGKPYFAELLSRVRDLRPGDLLLFTDWRGDPDERLADAGPEVSAALCAAWPSAAWSGGRTWTGSSSVGMRTATWAR